MALWVKRGSQLLLRLCLLLREFVSETRQYCAVRIYINIYICTVQTAPAYCNYVLYNYVEDGGNEYSMCSAPTLNVCRFETQGQTHLRRN